MDRQTHSEAQSDAEFVTSREPNAFLRFVAGRWLGWLIIFFATLALFATPLQSMRLLQIFSEPVRLGVSVFFVLATYGLVFVLRFWLLSVLRSLFDSCAHLPVWMIIAIGLFARIAWVVLFPAQPGSDGAVYLGLAEQLLQDGSYEVAGTRAYWPVGYPLFLVPWVAIFDEERLALLVSNMSLFVLGTLGVMSLARFLANDQAGRVAALVFALWPNLIIASGLPEKELVVLASLPWATLGLLSAMSRSGRVLCVLGAGLLLGACTLIQPSLQFLPFVAALLLVGSATQLRTGLRQAVLVLLGAAVVVAPWTYRNYLVFDTFVLVATNGGSVLYRANNPLATGGYTQRGEVDLEVYDEVAQDKEGRRLAVEWIKENPGSFLKLAVEKQIRFMGDEAGSVYGTFKVGGVDGSETLYAILKAAANAWWMLIWLLIGFLGWQGKMQSNVENWIRLIPVWLWTYLFAIHSVFESAGKYHVPVLWVPCVLLAVLLAVRFPRQGLS